MIATEFTLIGGEENHPTKPPSNNANKGKKEPNLKNFLAILIVFSSVIVIATFAITFGWVGALSMTILVPLTIYGGRKFNEAKARQSNNQ